ncbi:MAG: sterol desaturase family protein [Hahellaceae bacterium]|nr:sterol desaturase family protein [Hahellaceae bacterium]MCP5212750.1 sterol desaturase family protein [Hahellaceae bacterium]
MSELYQELIKLYQDPMFIQLPIATLLLSVGSFLLVATPWTILAWVDPEWAKPFKIQQKPFQVNKYFLPNMARITINSCMMLVFLVLTWPLLRLSGIHTGEAPAWYIWVSQIVFFLLLDDFLFYWMHRWLHENKWMLKNVHAVHHRIKNTCALDGNYFHWLEFVLIGSLAMAGPILLGCHIYVLYTWIIIRNIEAADGHAGYDFPWNPLRFLPLYDGPVYHDFHHAKFKGNYAGALHYIDRFFGTYIKEYLIYKKEHVYQKSTQRSNRMKKHSNG